MNIIEYDSLRKCEKVIVLFQNNHNISVFFNYDWMILWKQYFGEKYKDKILLFYEKEELVGFVPLVYYETKWIKKCIYMYYGGKMNAFNNIPVVESYKKNVYKELLNYLKQDKSAAYIKFKDIQNISSDFEIIHEFCNKKNGMELYQYSCPYNHLDTDWDTFFKRQISKSKKRTELRAFYKKLSKVGTVKFFRINDTDSWYKYNSLIADTFKIHALRFSKVINTSEYSNPKYKQFYIEFIENFAKNNKLDLSLLCIDGVLVSFLLSFNENGKLVDYIPGFHPLFAKLSLGHIHLMKLFEDLINEGKVHIFDFSKGLGVYKQKWSDSYYDNYSFNIRLNNSIISKLLFYLANYVDLMKLYCRNKKYNSLIKHILGSIKYNTQNNKVYGQKENKIIATCDKNEIIKESDYIIIDYNYHYIANLDINTQEFILSNIYESKKVKLLTKNNILKYIQISDKTETVFYSLKSI